MYLDSFIYVIFSKDPDELSIDDIKFSEHINHYMHISYKKLWKLLIDKEMLKKDLASKAKISTTSVAKLSKNENVNTEILLKICIALDCDVSDIMEIEK